jgi:hypothetical protein
VKSYHVGPCAIGDQELPDFGEGFANTGRRKAPEEDFPIASPSNSRVEYRDDAIIAGRSDQPAETLLER